MAAEEVNAQPQTKDVGTSSIQCPMLTSTNYTVWSIRMKIVLRLHKVWDTIDPGSADEKKNVTTIALLFQAIPENLILQVGELTTSKEIWEAIKSRHLGADRVKEARLQTLMAEFDRMKMNDSDTVEDFAGRISGLASKAASLGEVLEESKLVKKFLKSLPRTKYIQIVASLEQVLDLNTTGFEDIVGRLKAYEERIGEESQKEDQGKLMWSNNDQSNRENHGASRGGYGGGGNGNRGRGRSRGGGNRGRGRGRGRSYGQNSGGETDENTKKDRPPLICWRCDKPGHYVSVCPERPRPQEANLNETQTADDALYVHEVVFLNEDKVFPENYDTNYGDASVWYLDNGASNHMTGNKDYFSSLDESLKGKVKFGDGSYVDIFGKGTIVIVGKTGEKRALKEVYYIPDLKNNIISLGQATENGCEVHMKGDTLSLRDPHGRLFVQVMRSPNRLYKTPMEISYPRCLLKEEEANDNQDHNQVVNQDVNQDEPVPQQVVTRYGHMISKPRYLHGEPESYYEAVSSKEWIDEMEGELDSIVRNKTWEFVEKPAGVKTIGLKWIFKIKRKADGSVNKHKARLVAKGYVQQEVEHVPVTEQKVDILTKPLARIKFKEMRSLIGVEAIKVPEVQVGIAGVNVGNSKA